jgi:hypothetical protein
MACFHFYSAVNRTGKKGNGIHTCCKISDKENLPKNNSNKKIVQGAEMELCPGRYRYLYSQVMIAQRNEPSAYLS